MPWVSVKGINIKIVYPAANTKHTGFMGRTLQLTLPERAESFRNIKSHTLGTRSGVPQTLLGATKARIRRSERWRRSEIFRLSTNQNIIIQSSHSQHVQIVMKNMNVGIEDPNPLVRTYIVTDNQQQTQPIRKIKEEIHFENTHTKKKNRWQKRGPPSRASPLGRVHRFHRFTLAQGGGNSERDPSSPTLPWPPVQY